MKILFAVDSFFQLIEATNLRMTVFKDEEADIFIYSSTPNSNAICQNLIESKLFNKCVLVNSPLLHCGSSFSFFKKFPKYFIYLYTLISPKKYVQNVLNCDKLNYDLFLFSGVGAVTECIFNAIFKVNRKIRCYRFEDSYVSYTREYGKTKGAFRIIFERLMYKFFGSTEIDGYIDGYYFADPDLVTTTFNYPIIRAPKISRNNTKLVNVLNKVFNFSKIEDSYKEKYIFFESGDSYFEKNDEDIDFVKELVAIVAQDSVLIKRHPRFKNNRFSKTGANFTKSSSIPWELIQLNIKMDNKIFITTTSAAALTSSVYFNDDCKSILLFEMMVNKPSSVNNVVRDYFVRFQNKYGKDSLAVPKSKDEFLKLIKEN